MTANELIKLLETVKDKDKDLCFQVITGLDSNYRNNYEYYYNAEIWDEDIRRLGPALIIK